MIKEFWRILLFKGREKSILSLKALLIENIKFRGYIFRKEYRFRNNNNQKIQIANFNYKPLISIVVPIYKVPRDILKELLLCLQKQSYPYWQASMVWSDTDDLLGWQWLQNETKNDQRFTIEKLNNNSGISNNSNAALERVNGEYVALLDHDDLLSPWALFLVVKKMQSDPTVDFIYSDRDLIVGKSFFRAQPLFKPGWSPEMLFSANYLTHFTVIRTQLLRQLGGWRPETDGAQDWDLFLRISEQTQRIVHIPFILYHWRMIATSTALHPTVKPYVPQAQLKVLQDSFLRRGLIAKVTRQGNDFHVKWPIRKRSLQVVVMQTGTVSQLIEVMNQLLEQAGDKIQQLLVVHSCPIGQNEANFQTDWGGELIFRYFSHITWRTALSARLAAEEASTLLLLDGNISKISSNLLDELAGWTNEYSDVVWTGAIALNESGICFEAGRVVSSSYLSAPLFYGVKLSSATNCYLGSPNGYRNARACSPYAVAMRTTAISAALEIVNARDERVAFTQFCCALTTQGKRGLINPFAKIYFKNPPEKVWPNNGKLYHDDPYFHLGFKQVSPIKLD